MKTTVLKISSEPKMKTIDLKEALIEKIKTHVRDMAGCYTPPPADWTELDAMLYELAGK